MHKIKFELPDGTIVEAENLKVIIEVNNDNLDEDEGPDLRQIHLTFGSEGFIVDVVENGDVIGTNWCDHDVLAELTLDVDDDE